MSITYQVQQDLLINLAKSVHGHGLQLETAHARAHDDVHDHDHDRDRADVHHVNGVVIQNFLNPWKRILLSMLLLSHQRSAINYKPLHHNFRKTNSEEGIA